MASAPVVGIVGVKALGRDIAKLAEDERSPLYAALKQAGRTAANPVVTRTRDALPRGPRTTGRLQRDVRVSATRTGAAIRMGRVSVPWAGWVEFGGTRPDGSSREYIPTGRYLFPAARALGHVAAVAYSDAINRTLNASGVWTNTTSDGSQVHD
jgi:hypothetical protein